MKIYNGYEWSVTKFDWGYGDQEYVQHLFDENRILRVALTKLYNTSKEMVNEIICLGGDTICPPCRDREKLSQTLLYVKKVLNSR